MLNICFTDKKIMLTELILKVMTMNFNKFNLFLSASLLATLPAYAQESNDTAKSEWRANFRRVALDISSTSVGNAEEYKDSPNSKLSADGEEVVKGVFDFMLEHETSDSRWDNGVYAEYGKTKLKPAEGEDTKSENADKILFSTDYTQKVWKWDEADVGPFASLGYQTEFTQNDDAPRTKVLRGKAGVKALNGTYFDEMYAALVQDWDMTYDEDIQKTAAEVGGRWKYNLRDGVDFKLEGYYRRYFTYSKYNPTDFKDELSGMARMDVELKNNFKLAPFVQYFRAKARGAEKYGDNVLIGVSLGYVNMFDL